MTTEEKNKLLIVIKNSLQFNSYGVWWLKLDGYDYDFRNECSSLEEYQQSVNYLIEELIKDKELTDNDPYTY